MALTQDQVDEVCRLANDGAKPGQIGAQLGLTTAYVTRIIRGEAIIQSRHVCGICGTSFMSGSNGPRYCSRACSAEKIRSNRPPLQSKPTFASPEHVAAWPSGRQIWNMSMLPEQERRKATLGWPEFARTEGLRRGWISEQDLFTARNVS